MVKVIGPPTVSQLKKWIANKTLVTFETNNATYSDVLIYDLSRRHNMSIDIAFQQVTRYEDPWHLRDPYDSDEEYRKIRTNIFMPLKSITSYIARDIINSILSKNNSSKNEVTLLIGNTLIYARKKPLEERSKFFRNLIKSEEKKLSRWNFFKCNFELKKNISINLNFYFNNEYELNLLLNLIDQQDLDDFIFTIKDILSLLDIVNKYPLQKNQTSNRRVEERIKDKFFELIRDDVPFNKPERLDIKTQIFLNNLKSELLAYSKRNKTTFCQHLLIYCAQIEKEGKLNIDASINPDFLAALKLLIFCKFPISTLITKGIIPSLFKHLGDINTLPLLSLKINSTPDDKYNYFCSDNFYQYGNLDPLFKLMEHSKTLIQIQIGDQKIYNSNNRSKRSFIEIPPHFCEQSKTVEHFNLLKPIVEARFRSFYEPAVVNRFFNKYLPMQQSRLLTEFLTIEDLDKVRQASRNVYLEIKNSVNKAML
ncbi:MAG: hypothetical protein H2069_10405 [Legionella sp.]|nr:hypothetical protein [Legionella sp.]